MIRVFKAGDGFWSEAQAHIGETGTLRPWPPPPSATNVHSLKHRTASAIRRISSLD
jgi:hypothetical protein